MSLPTSNSTAAELARELTQATRPGVNLSEALQAAAEGSRNRRLASALRAVAERVNRGEPLEQILTHDSPLPLHLAGLMRASLATGQPALAIAEWLFARERARSHWHNVLGAISYPLATLAGTYVVFLFFSIWLIPDLRAMLDDMGLKIPAASRAIFWFTEKGAPLSLAIFGGVAVLLLLVRVIGGRSVWSQLVSAAPVIGPLWLWSGSSELLRALAILLDRRIPLPQALQLTGEGISDAALAGHCRRLAARVEQGSELTRAMQSSPELPPSIFPLIRSGERSGTLPDSLRAAAEMLESRLQAQASIVMQLAPTLIFLAITGMALMMVAGFMVPLLTLIQGLT